MMLNPWFITGFIDGEGSFICSIYKASDCKLGWRVSTIFSISLHINDLVLLQRIQSFFGVGSISINKNSNTAIYIVKSIQDIINIIIPHFIRYPLLTQKKADFLLFKSIAQLINNKEHLTKEGLYKILNIKASLNNGLTKELIKSFPNLIPSVERPKILALEIQDTNWLVGFSDGEACFDINIFKSTTSKLGEAVKLRFRITQHSRDIELMENIINYLDCGNLHQDIKRSLVYVTVTKFSDITDKIIPFFNNNPLQGTKVLDYKNFCQAALLMKAKAHLTTSGLEQIREIKSQMNRGRS
jgi:hypothetical protein